MKTSVVDNFRDPEETPIAVDAPAKPLPATPVSPALGDFFVVAEGNEDMSMGPYKTEYEAIAAAKEDFTDNDPEGDELYFLCRIAKKLRLFRPVQVDELESEDR